MKHNFFSLLLAGMMMLPMYAQQGALTGQFSVGPSKQVKFSQGYLQFNAAQGKHACADRSQQKGTWRFAASQLEFIGEQNTNIGENYDGWIDLLGWGASGYNGRHPWQYVHLRLEDVPAADDLTMYDYGVYNAISNGGNKPGLWRCLTGAEWEYLLEKRPFARHLQGMTRVNGILGLMIIPDCETEQEFLYLTAQDDIPKEKADNIHHWENVTEERWKVLESRGAVFMPLAGMMRLRDEGFQFRDWIGGVFASPCNEQHQAYIGGCSFSDTDSRAEVREYNNVHSHTAIRLVCDVK